MDYELLKKRREKYLKLQKEMGEEQHIGLGYVLTVDGKQYPVMACFSVGGETEDTAHYIRESVLDTIVLHNLKIVTAFARENPDEFYAMATENGEEAERFYRNTKREKEQLEKRIQDLDNIIRCLYEDRVTGWITPEPLRVFIRRIEVYEKFEKYSRTAGNPIRIHYAFRLPEQTGIPAIEVLAQPTAKAA